MMEAMRRRRWSWIACLFVCGCGRLLDVSDAGDAGDAASDAPDDGPSFQCGEGSIFVYCEPSTEYCLLVKTSQAHHYSCVGDPPPSCTNPTSAPGDCGCYVAPNGDVYVTECP